MDALRANLSGYYTPQQYTPIPLPTYPPPTFSEPSPYPRHHAIPPSDHNPLQRYNHDPACLVQTIAESEGLLQARGSTRACEDADADGNASFGGGAGQDSNAVSKHLKGGSAPKGFGHTSAVYRIDGNGVKRRVNADDFRSEVEERTRNGESCEQIADALIAQGAQVTSKSVSRWRILWGFRKRAVRKQSKPPKPKDQRMNTKQLWQSKYKADITRMTHQGLDASEIAHIMSARGMELKKGPSTIARLQTVWKLRGTEESRIKNKRYLSRRKARQQQFEEFQNYARELDLSNPDEWVKKKMDEPAIRDMRRSAAYELMGDAAPEPKASRTNPVASRSRNRQSPDIVSAAVQASVVQAMPEISVAYMSGSPDTSSDDDEVADLSPMSHSVQSVRKSAGDTGTQAVSHGISESSAEDPGLRPTGSLDHDGGYHMGGDSESDCPALIEKGPNDSVSSENVHTSANINGPRAISNLSTNNFLPSVQITNATTTFIPVVSEYESMEKLYSLVDAYIGAAQSLKELWKAKSDGRAGPYSLTGLPPSTRDIEVACHKLKEAAIATVNILHDPA